MSLRVTLTFDEPERYEQPEGTLTGTFTERYRCGFCQTTADDDLELAEHGRLAFGLVCGCDRVGPWAAARVLQRIGREPGDVPSGPMGG